MADTDTDTDISVSAKWISVSAISVSVSVSAILDIGYIVIGQILAQICGYRPPKIKLGQLEVSSLLQNDQDG